jgi:hypothetical protein
MESLSLRAERDCALAAESIKDLLLLQMPFLEAEAYLPDGLPGEFIAVVSIPLVEE